MERIYITQADKIKLQKLAEDLMNDPGVKEYAGLFNELKRAVVVATADLPRNVITMHSTVQLCIDNADTEEYTLVYPDETDIAQNRISVLSPIGTAILGYREGDHIQWKVPEGVSDIFVKKVLYQPESAGVCAKENANPHDSVCK